MSTIPNDPRLATLVAYSEQIESIDKLRAGLVSDIDDLIARLRDDGCPWPLINQALGTTNVQVSWQRRRAAATETQVVVRSGSAKS